MANSSWKVWLRLNRLITDIDNDYVAEVLAEGKTLHNTDLAQLIMEEGSEVKHETVLSILDKADRKILEQIRRGNRIQTGNYNISPRILGTWIGSNAKYNAAVHKKTVDIIPTAELRLALNEVGVDVLGVKEGGAYIGLVTDTFTGLSDDVITPNEDILIEGEKIKVVPDNDADSGVFFVNSATGESTPVTRRLTQNEPKTVIARVPNLPAGLYTLKIVTRFSSSATLLKAPRTIEYDRLLTVV